MNGSIETKAATFEQHAAQPVSIVNRAKWLGNSFVTTFFKRDRAQSFVLLFCFTLIG